MRSAATRLLGSVTLAATLTACDEPAAPPVERLGPTADIVTASCAVVPALNADARAYFTARVFEDVEELIAALGASCGSGSADATAAAAWRILRIVEVIARDGRGVDLAAGSRFVNGLLACTVSQCLTGSTPGIDFTAALGPAGVFAVRGGADARTALAHGRVELVDFSGTPVQALWGVEVTRRWPDVVFVPTVLVYGSPGGNLTLQEVAIGQLQIVLDVFPDAGRFPDGALHVGICFSAPIALPHVGNDESRPSLAPRMQREGVLLEQRTPSFCPNADGLDNASLAGAIPSRIRALVGSFLPALRSDRKITVIGGTPLDFSTFAPVAANPEGSLQVATQPKPVIQSGQSIGKVRITALSGAGTPIEKVSVTLRVVGTQGTEDGALGGTTQSLTREFDDPGAAVFDNTFTGPPGTYRLCATGSLPGFTFTPVCTAPFQVN